MRLVLVLACLASTLGFAASKERSHRKWKCHFVGRMVFCDLLDAPPLQHRWPADGVLLLERRSNDFEPLVQPPQSLRAK
jgi:hypothetical protein